MTFGNQEMSSYFCTVKLNCRSGLTPAEVFSSSSQLTSDKQTHTHPKAECWGNTHRALGEMSVD